VDNDTKTIDTFIADKTSIKIIGYATKASCIDNANENNTDIRNYTIFAKERALAVQEYIRERKGLTVETYFCSKPGDKTVVELISSSTIGASCPKDNLTSIKKL
jgi:hypothetical protein